MPRKGPDSPDGSLNAKVEMDDNGYEYIMGRHGLEEKNEAVGIQANLCALNLLQHKSIHKTTWIALDQTMENQIDHIYITKNLEG
ncbi:unnamed protein product [Schistosoma margrebowiei]|uniref:Uncharacterized protein n=1 Tax=Schistosoma margrebowiei TaxID=48269 RepID=A0A183LI94_9TREM|nr:unnamed protein product [Schistosoma margrebowiei]